jgi:hypothetical protein
MKTQSSYLVTLGRRLGPGCRRATCVCKCVEGTSECLAFALDLTPGSKTNLNSQQKAEQTKTPTPTTIVTMKLIPCSLLVLYATAPTVADARRRGASASVAFKKPRRDGVSSVNVRRTNDPSRPSSSSTTTRATESDVVFVGIRGGEGGGTASMSSEMFNMVKAVVGVGVLSLPAGE